MSQKLLILRVISCISLIAASPVELNSRASNIPQRCDTNSVTPISCANVNSTDGLVPHPDDCELFYYCIAPYFPPICRQCPASLHFNPVLHVCDYPYNAGCQVNITTTTESVPTTDVTNTTWAEVTNTTWAEVTNTTWIPVTEPTEWNVTETETEGTTANYTTEDYTAIDDTNYTTTEVPSTDNYTTGYPDYTTSDDYETTTDTTKDNYSTTEYPTTEYPTSEYHETTEGTTQTTLKWKFLNTGEIKYSNVIEIV